MKLHLRREWALLTVFTVLAMFLNPRVVNAQDHVVPLSELRREPGTATRARAKNLSDLDRVLSLPAARGALQKVNVTQDQARKAVSVLSDEELSRLADRARSAEHDVQGGLIVGLLALIGLIVVVLIVVSVVR